MAIKNGDTLRVHYTGTLSDGTVFDSSREREPLEFTMGKGMLIPGFESPYLVFFPSDMAIPLLNVQFLEFFTRHERIEHLEQRVRAQMLWQVKLREQPLPGGLAVRTAGEPGCIEIRLRNACARSRWLLPFDGRARTAQRLEQHIRAHSLHAEFALLGGGALAPLLSGNIRDVPASRSPTASSSRMITESVTIRKKSHIPQRSV